MLAQDVAAPFEARARRARPRRAAAGALEARRRELAAFDRDEVRHRLLAEDVLDVLRAPAARRDEERVGEVPAGGEHEPARRLDGGGGQRVLGGEARVHLALRRRAEVVALGLELPPVRQRVGARGDGLGLQALELVEALGPHLGRHDAVQVFLQVDAIDDV